MADSQSTPPTQTPNNVVLTLQALQAYRVALTAQFFALLIIIVVLAITLEFVEKYNQNPKLKEQSAETSSQPASTPASSTLGVFIPAPINPLTSEASVSTHPALAANAASGAASGASTDQFTSGGLTIFPYTILAGALGALISALQRLYKLESFPSALLSEPKILKNRHLWMYSMIPLIVGMVAAAFFYVLSETGLISGALLISFKCTREPESACNGSMGGLLAYSPVTPQDYAKALILGFVAGFSERLFPDALASLASAVTLTSGRSSSNDEVNGTALQPNNAFPPTGPAPIGAEVEAQVEMPK